MSLSIPTTYAGRYTLERPIGEGAFSRTFLAYDSVLDRRVAVKVLRREYVSSEEFTARFDREAHAAAMVSHPNVVPVYDYGREGGLPFIVMQYVDGQTLRAFARDEGPLTIEEVVSLARQVLNGLSAIHEAGIIHRDVKPQNVLLDRALVAWLSDFGVAFLTQDPSLTQTGATIGTAAYMAPEQATGQTIGPQADLYAVGVMLYELLTGSLPFRGDNPVQVLYRHVSELPVRPRQLNQSIPLELEAAILRSLAKLPADRYVDARTMRDAIVGARGPSQPTIRTAAVRPERDRFQPVPATPSPGDTTPTMRANRRTSRTSRRWPLFAALIAVLLAATGVVLAVRQISSIGSWPSGSSVTPVENQQPAAGIEQPDSPTAAEVPGAAIDPAATPTSDAAVVPPPELTPTEEPSLQETPNPEPGGSATTTAPDGAPAVEFNAPFPARSLPLDWQGGSSATFGRDDFVAGGAYRRQDGELYGRPAAHLYSQATDYPSTTVEFLVPGQPNTATNHIGIVIIGMDDELPGAVPMRISLNDEIVWEGDSPFENETWTTVGWHVGNLTWIKPGRNRFRIEVLTEDGEFGQPPWILLNEASIYWD